MLALFVSLIDTEPFRAVRGSHESGNGTPTIRHYFLRNYGKNSAMYDGLYLYICWIRSVVPILNTVGLLHREELSTSERN